MRILVIDDDKTFSEPHRWQLEEDGYDVTYCQSVEEVLDEEGKLKVPIPDCIILDVMMPRGGRYSKNETAAGKNTGLRLLEDIQKQLPDTPVIIATIRDDLDEAAVQKRFKSVRKMLTKPISMADVANAIKAMHLQKSGVQE